MDFSFRTGFRESCSTASLIQVGGRVSRGGEHEEATVWDFRTFDPMLTQHKAFEVPRRVLDTLFEHGMVLRMSPSELAKEAMRRELTEGERNRADEICQAEAGMEYPQVSELCRVIEGDARLVIVAPKLVAALEQFERVDPIRLLRHSVQIRTRNVERFPVRPVFARSGKELYAWTAAYDPDFLGYMAGVLPILDGLRGGIFLA